MDKAISIPINCPVGSEREKIETIARALEIDQNAKTDDELKQLITEKMNL